MHPQGIADDFELRAVHRRQRLAVYMAVKRGLRHDLETVEVARANRIGMVYQVAGYGNPPRIEGKRFHSH